MKKTDFLLELNKKLSGLPKDDRERSLEYYSEMIADRMEDGIPEEKAVADLGPIDKIYADIVSDVPLNRLIKTKLTPKSSLGVWKIILLVFGFLVFGLPLLIAFFSIAISFYAVIWSLVISVWAVTLSLLLGGIFGIVVFFPTLFIGTTWKAIFILGAAIFSLGLVFPFFCISKYAFKGALILSKAFLLLIKKMLVRS